jgi:hypothetical protein
MPSGPAFWILLGLAALYVLVCWVVATRDPWRERD